MTMCKPGTQLIMVEPWAREAAIKLGFLVEPYNTRGVTDWRITVTESGPNAAERFLPQVGDFIFNGECVKVVDDFNGLGVPGFIHPTCAAETLTVKGFRYDTGARRIIERNGTPFPQFSEVIEPYFRNSQR